MWHSCKVTLGVVSLTLCTFTDTHTHKQIHTGPWQMSRWRSAFTSLSLSFSHTDAHAHTHRRTHASETHLLYCSPVLVCLVASWVISSQLTSQSPLSFHIEWTLIRAWQATAVPHSVMLAFTYTQPRVVHSHQRDDSDPWTQLSHTHPRRWMDGKKMREENSALPLSCLAVMMIRVWCCGTSLYRCG